MATALDKRTDNQRFSDCSHAQSGRLASRSVCRFGVELRPTKANRRSTALSNRYWTWCDRSTSVAFVCRG
jgi:hypothetical protein